MKGASILSTCGLLLGIATAQATWASCAPRSAQPEMVCIGRIGHCVEVRIDGHTTTPISEADQARVNALPGMRNICWKITQPVSSRFRVQARSGGLNPQFVGDIDSLGVLVFNLSDFDLQFDRSIESLHNWSAIADGYRDGTWQITPRNGGGVGTTPDGLKAGEYIISVRVMGLKNWDHQQVLLRIDPKLQPVVEQLVDRSANQITN